MKQFLLLLFLGTMSITAKAQISVNGVVKDAMNEPLPGISIAVENSTTGTITDLDGKYNLTVPNAQSTLIFSFIGYKTQHVTVGNRTVINITLEEDIATLDEVVVVGYGTQKKVNVTGAVASISFDELAESRPITSVSSSLAGLGAGLGVTQASGQPGSDGATLRIRGIGTLNDNSPLVMIDGMQGSMDDLNPNDIASISILKDAASAAIYGSRAGSGVILITTKSGGKQGKATVNYSGRISITNPVNLPDLVTNYADFMKYNNEAWFQAGNDTERFPQSEIDLWIEKGKRPNELNEFGYPNYVAYPNTDWMDAVYNKNSLMHEHNVSISGSSDKTRYLMSAGYLNNPGLIDNSGMERFNMRVNLEADVTDWLTVGTRTYGNKDAIGRLDFSGNIIDWIMTASPGECPYYDGMYGHNESVYENPNANNITQKIDAYNNGKKDRTRVNTTMYAKVKILKGLTWDANINYNRFWQDTSSWGHANTGRRYRFSQGVEATVVTPNSQLQTSNGRVDKYSYTLEHLLNYSRTFAKHHDVTALVGYQEYYYKRWTNGATMKGLIDETIPNFDAATEILSTYGVTNDRASRSVFGRLTYAYKSRYLMEFNMRYDGHSRFASEHRWGTFPSLSLGWRITEEKFMAGTRNWLDNLKLRASWGKNGNFGGTNSETIDYEYQGGYSPILYPFGDTQYAGLVQQKIANPALQWETSEAVNVGLDAAFFNNRLTVDVDAYQKKTDGILYRISIPIIAGDKTAPRLNLAEMKNYGYELSVGWNDRIRDFNYGVSANIGFSRNEITKYKGRLEQGWVTGSNGKESWQTNLGDVSQGTNERVLEGHMYNEYFIRKIHRGKGNNFNADGTVNVQGGPRDGMIRTEEDMEWVKAMVAAGHSFYDTPTVGNRGGLYYGDYIFADLNGDGVYGNDADRDFTGSSKTPKYTYGFQLYGAWKGFDLSMNFAGAAGFDILWTRRTGYNSSTVVEWGMGLSDEVAKNHYFYDPENPTDPRTNIHAKYARLTTNFNASNDTYASDLFLHKGDYLKLKNLTLGYTLPKAITAKANLEKVRVYFSGENLFSIDSFPGPDPEQGAVPEYQPVRSYSFGLNVTF